MPEYTQNSRYYHITEDPNLVQTDLIVFNTTFTETTVRDGEQDNPEIIAQRVYNNPHYWWVICQYNGIINPKDIPLGKNLKCPNITVPPRNGL